MTAVLEIAQDQRKKVAEELAILLADTYTLYLKTHNFHWNVKGHMFQALHTLFEQQYQDLAAASDLIAERIRALDFPAPGSYAEFGKLTSVKEAVGVPKAEDMIRQLFDGHKIVSHCASRALDAAEKADDQATMDLLTERLQTHEKAAWMLKSLLDE